MGQLMTEGKPGRYLLSESDVNTPALLVDMNVMESNLEKMAAFFRGRLARLRPRYKNHKGAASARRQRARGTIGMSCATLAEAEALAGHGIDNVLIVNEIAGTAQLERMARLSRESDVIVAVGNQMTVLALSSVSTRFNVKLSVVVDVNTGMGRCGATSGEPALALSRSATEHGLPFCGLTGYEGHCGRLQPCAEKVDATTRAKEKLVGTAKLV